MSEGVVEKTRQGYGEFNDRDVDALYARLVPDFQWNEAAEIPGPKSCATRDEFIRYMRGFDLLWEEFAFEPIELTEGSPDDGYDVVYAKMMLRGRGKASEEDVEILIHHVWRLRDGLFVRMDAYLDEHDARRAAGLLG
ncbi:MAG TPA: nuclear transport factor 2 family protein [Solirubrobacterales bacterium]|nr:nuclear transport factor 2 family protein [Solirubrobacterales bacterium]